MNKPVTTAQGSHIALTDGADVISKKEITLPWSELVHLAAGYIETSFANSGEIMRHVIGENGSVNGHSIDRYNMTYNRKQEILGLSEDSLDSPDFNVFCTKDPRVQSLPHLEEKVLREAGIHLVLLQHPELAQAVVDLKEQVAALTARSAAAKKVHPHRTFEIARAQHKAFMAWFEALDEVFAPAVLRSENAEAVQTMIDRKWAHRRDLAADSILAGMRPSQAIDHEGAALTPDGSSARARGVERLSDQIIGATTKRNPA